MISVRPAASADARDLFAWRNDPDTRAASITQDEVSWDGHVAWFERSLASDSRRIYLAEDDGVAVGMVRFDLDDGGVLVEVSINLAPAARGTGRSGAVLAAGIRAFAEEHPTRTLTARIRDDNVPSRRLFAAAGFVPDGQDQNGVGSYVRPGA